MRLLVLLCAGLLCFGVAPAVAQEPTPDPEATEQLDPEQLDPEELNPEETAIPDDEDPYTTPGCEGTDGTDGDYTYCGCGDEVGTEGDYVYCPAARPGGGPGARVDDDDDSGGGKRRGGPGGDVDAAQALPNTLPLTGGHPAVISMIGLGFLMVGAGGRLQQRPGAGRDSA